MKWYIEVLKKYAVFSGRASRAEFWSFILINLAILVGLGIVDISIGTWHEDFGTLESIYALAVLLPSLAVQIRRLHDIGRSGSWWFIIIIPLIGGFALLFFWAQDSQPGPNQYGPNPKEMTNLPAP